MLKVSTPARDRHLKNAFGCTPEEWDAVDAYQGHRCALCGRPQKSGKRLATDHCHSGVTAGEFRGLLCSSCNRFLGQIERGFIRLGSDINCPIADFLARVISYLEVSPVRLAIGRRVFGFPGRIGTKRYRKYLRQEKLKLLKTGQLKTSAPL